MYSFFEYPTTTPGSNATTLFPSSHCSRSAWYSSPPVVTTRSFFRPNASCTASRNTRLAGHGDLTLAVARPETERRNRVDHGRVHGDRVPVEEGEDRIEVHVCPIFRHLARDYPLGPTAREERLRELLYHQWRRPLAAPDEHGAASDRHDVPTLERGVTEVVQIEACVVPLRRVPEVE